MAFEYREGSGCLFKNKKQSDKAPDYRGGMCMNGVQYEISAWLKTAKDNSKFMSLAIKPKGEKQLQTKANAPDANDEPFSDSVPF